MGVISAEKAELGFPTVWQQRAQRFKASRSSGLPGATQQYPKSPRVIRQPNDAHAVRVAVIDGPYDTTALAPFLAQAPVSLGNGNCSVPNSACNHGTFVMGLLGARRDALIPGTLPRFETAAHSAVHRRGPSLGERSRTREGDHYSGHRRRTHN